MNYMFRNRRANCHDLSWLIGGACLTRAGIGRSACRAIVCDRSLILATVSGAVDVMQFSLSQLW